MIMTKIAEVGQMVWLAVLSFLRNASGNPRRIPGRGRQKIWEIGNVILIFRSVPSGVYQIEDLLLKHCDRWKRDGKHVVFILHNDHGLFDVPLDLLTERGKWIGTIKVREIAGMPASRPTYTITGTLLHGKLQVRHESEKRFWKRVLRQPA